MNDELADIWQGQPTGGVTISLEELKNRARRLKAKLKRRGRIQVAVWILLLVTVSGRLLFFEYAAATWFLAAQFVLYIAVFTMLRAPWNVAATPEGRVLTFAMLAAPVPCVEFYRKELEARRSDLLHGRKLAPVLVLVGAILALFGTQRSRNQFPIVLAGLAGMVIAFFWLWKIRRESPQVQAELEDLNAAAPKDDQPNGSRK